MKKLINRKIIVILSIIFIFFGVNFVYADSYGLEKTAGAAGLKDAVSGSSPADIIGNVVGAALTLVGVLFLLLMIYGGIIWMIARGNEQETDKALKTIKAAVIGLIIVVASYAITTFVFNAISGEPTTEPSASVETAGCYNIPQPSPMIPDCDTTDCSAYDTSALCAELGEVVTGDICCVWREGTCVENEPPTDCNLVICSTFDQSSCAVDIVGCCEWRQ